MRRHVKASSAASTQGSGTLRARIHRAFATRGASPGAKGSGAPSPRSSSSRTPAEHAHLPAGRGQRRRAARVPLALLAALSALIVIALALAPAPASAATYENLCTPLGEPSFCGGGHHWAFFDAVDNSAQPSAGSVYMTTLGISGANSGVWKFGPGGEEVAFTGTNPNISGNELKVASPSTTVGPVGIAVDSTTGNFYIANRENQNLEEFTSAGEPVPAGTISLSGIAATGVAVDNSGGLSGGDIYIANEGAGTVEKYAPGGPKLGQSTPGEGGAPALVPYGLAVDPTGHVYAATNGSGAVQKFSESLAFEATIGEPTSQAVAVDPLSGDVFVSYGAQVQEYTSAGAEVGSPIAGLNAGSHGLAVSGVGGAAHRLYATNELEGESNGIIFGQLGPHQPLTVKKTGTGDGTLTSVPSGINCAPGCTEQTAEFEEGSTVTLTAEEDGHSTFAGWGAGQCAEEPAPNECKVEMTEAKLVEAEFTKLPQQKLKVEPIGTGTGTVTSNTPGITCSGPPPTGTCEAEFNEGSTVTLTEAPAAHSHFVAWTGCTAEPSLTECEVEMTATKTVKAEFEKNPQKTLTVEKTGSGAAEGTVESSPGGISCGATCEAEFDQNEPITLTATAPAHFKFIGWTNCETPTGNECSLILAADTTVEAEFEAIPQETLKIVKTGSGATSGTVTGPEIECGEGPACEHSYDQGTVLTLTATAPAHFKFIGWTNCETPVGNECTLTLNANTTVEAEFEAIPQETLNLGSGTAAGTVASSPEGINCGDEGPACEHAFDQGTVVTLTATPAAHQKFVAWSAIEGNPGTCIGATNPCQVTMSEAVKLVAEFKVNTQFTLAVAKAGAGSGTVTSNPAGINCGETCSAKFDEGAKVTLTASAASGSTFAGWSGGGCSGKGTCVINAIAAATEVTANFTLNLHTLNVAKTGVGSGAITSAPAGIDCGATCSHVYKEGAEVTLTATPGAGSTFTGWSGGCSGTGPCKVTLNKDIDVSADFHANPHTLFVADSGSGSGSVTSAPAGIDCGITCSHSYVSGTTITLTASPAAGSSFGSWSGCTAQSYNHCTVVLGADTTVVAIFNQGSGVKLGKATVKGATASLKVTVPGAGSLTASGKKLKKAKAASTGPSTMTLHLALTSAGRKALKKAKGHKLKVKVKLTFTPTGGPPSTLSTTVTFKEKSKKKH